MIKQHTRVKIKWKSAEAKAKSMKNIDKWKEFLKQQGIQADEKKKARGMSAPPLTAKAIVSPRGDTSREIPSMDTGMGACTAKPIPEYTGTAMIGIAIQHKSCLQPIFNIESAKDSAKMRR